MPKNHLTRYITCALLLFSATSASRAGWGDFFKRVLPQPAEPASNTPQPAVKPSSSALAALSEEQLTRGLKEALAVGTENAIQSLGQKDGFLKNAQVKIPLPKELADTEKTLRLLGQGQRVDELVTTMNRAAEAATPEASKIIGDAIRAMTIKDARQIWRGKGNEATQYFQQTADARLREKLRPVIQAATNQTGVTRSYKKLTGNVSAIQSIIPAEALDLDEYITNKTLSGLYLTIGEEEKKIRTNPTARTTDLLKKVFGAQP